MTFRILVVCTANICRSPTAERLLRARLTAASTLDVDVSSAGVDAVEGCPPCDLSLALSSRHAGVGVVGPPDGWSGSAGARRLTQHEVDVVDLVLAADRTHRAAVVSMRPGARARTFTVTESARLAGAVGQVLDSGRLPEGAPAMPRDADAARRWLVSEWDAARGVVRAPDVDTAPTTRRARRWPGSAAPPLSWHPDDVPDPHAIGYETHPLAVERIAAAVDVVAKALSQVPPR